MITDTLVVMVFLHFRSSSSHPGRSRVAKIIATTLVVTGMGISAGSADPAVDPLPYRSELPDYGIDRWIFPRATGISYAGSAKQWIRLPPLFSSTYNRDAPRLEDKRCSPPVGRLYPYTDETKRSAAFHLQSSPGARKHYGYVGPFTVRTVAFGSIPVEAQIQLQQARDAQDKTIGLEFSTTENGFCPGLDGFNIPDTIRVAYIHDSQIKGELKVAVTALRVDGVNLKLRSTCRTSEFATMKLTAPDYYVVNHGVGEASDYSFYLDNAPGAIPLLPEQTPRWKANMFTTVLYSAGNGGLLTGNVTIPGFESCVTSSGEDVSRLLTATVSGNTNPVVTRAEGLDPSASAPGNSPLPALPFPTTAP